LYGLFGEFIWQQNLTISSKYHGAQQKFFHFHSNKFVLIILKKLYIKIRPMGFHYYHHTHNNGNYANFFIYLDVLTGNVGNYPEFLEQQINKAFQEKKE
jgi:hypothetical protein